MLSVPNTLLTPFQHRKINSQLCYRIIIIKKSTPRKTNNSNLNRSTSTNVKQHDQPSIKTVHLVKCEPATDKTQICYPYVVGELDIPQTDVNNNNGIQTGSFKNFHVNR